MAVENGTSKDRNGKYSSVNNDGRAVVYIDAVNMGKEKWDSYLVEMKAKLGKGEVVTNLVGCLSFWFEAYAHGVIVGPSSAPFTSS